MTGWCLLWRQIVNQGGCLSVTAGGQSHGFTYSFCIANCICRCSPYYERHVMTLRDRRRQWQKSKTKIKNTPRDSAAASPYVGAQREHHRQETTLAIIWKRMKSMFFRAASHEVTSITVLKSCTSMHVLQRTQRPG